jgi:putative ABC transport system substrate-binding protein
LATPVWPVQTGRLPLIFEELAAKRLQLLRELVPVAVVVALLVNPTNPVSDPVTGSLQDAARYLGLQARVPRASTASEIDAAFGALAEFGAGALILGGDPFFTNQRTQIVALAARHAVPAIYADLPVEQPTKLDLVVNLKTAKTLGLTIPQSILARADEVIE